MAKVTISDIAKKAGVSKSTVSRVLNNATDISEETKNRILDLMKSEGYTPSAAARTLSKQTSNTVGVIIPEIDNPFFGEMLRGIIDVLDENDLSMICLNTDNKPEKDLKALEIMKNHQVRGLIYTPAADYTKDNNKAALSKMIKQLDIPVIQVDRIAGCFESDSILFKDADAIYTATEKLIKAGHTKIGIINASLDFYHARIRQEGFLKAMENYNIPVQERYLFFGDYYFEKSCEIAKEMLEMQDRPTAVITCNNNSTLGLIKALTDRSETLSKDIACIGLDKIKTLDMVGMNLNYIERDSNRMGKAAVDALIRRLALPDQPLKTVYLDTPLVIKMI